MGHSILFLDDLHAFLITSGWFGDTLPTTRHGDTGGLTVTGDSDSQRAGVAGATVTAT